MEPTGRQREGAREAPPCSVSLVASPTPGSAPSNHSAAVIGLGGLPTSVTLTVRVTGPAEACVAWFWARVAATVGALLSTTKVVAVSGPQFPAASLPCTQTVKVPSL